MQGTFTHNSRPMTPDDTLRADRSQDETLPDDATVVDANQDNPCDPNQADANPVYRCNPASDFVQLQTGTPVTVQNLGVRPEFNGKHATVMFFNPKKGRYKVKLADGMTLLLKTECVRRTRSRLVTSLICLSALCLAQMGALLCRVRHRFDSNMRRSNVGFRLLCFSFFFSRTIRLAWDLNMRRVLSSVSSLMPFFMPLFTVFIIIRLYIATSPATCAVCDSCSICVPFVMNESSGH